MTESKRSGRRAVLFASVVFYVVLLIASHVSQYAARSYHSDSLANADLPHLQLEALDAYGSPIDGKTTTLYYEQWAPDQTAGERVPILLIHGSPGSGSNFELLGPELASDARRVIAPDLPGYGYSPLAPSMSHETNARYMFGMLDQLGIDRVHVVGWSSGGGVVLEMAHLAPDRVASLTLLASIGAQETEGSGSYFFEHVKYGVGLVLLGGLPELIPHFGVLGDRTSRTGWLWAFWDADQRRLTRFMSELEMPALILHGRHDPLVADWAAERHHAMMPNSQLVMLDASHFLPFLQVQTTRDQLLAFFQRHDAPGVAPEIGSIDLAPVPNRTGGDALLHRIGTGIWELPWWVSLIVCTLLIRVRPNLGIVLTLLFVAMLRIDFGVGLLSMIVGRSWWLLRGAKPIDRPWLLIRWVRGFLFVIPAFVIGSIGGSWTLSLSAQYGWAGIIGGVWLTWLAMITLRLVVTREGRQRMKGASRRLANHEYWPSGIIYLPVLWWGFKRVLSGKGLRPLTAVNPGYSFDGGVQEERKSELNDRMGTDTSVLQCILIDTDRDLDARTKRAIELLESDVQLGGLPVIAKPDRGERGRGVRLIRTHDDLRRYCKAYDESFVLQRFHPGPIEVGIVWVRDLESIEQDREPAGSIYAINIKAFPELHGDGRHTLRQLILRHPRHRAQASMFLESLREQQHLIPEDGERVSLGFAGNHAQGAMFSDGAHLITPELSDRIDRIARNFRDERGMGFDIGRFDIRCASYEALQRGEEMGIVELNGLTSEPTNLYDPDRSITWAWGMLMGYWEHAAVLSDARIAHGSGQPIGKAEMRTRMIALIRVMLG
jgi:pimeloyl-ACP methyl ester carboxylesterase